MRTIIEGATVVDPSSGLNGEHDILIAEDGKILEIAAPKQLKNVERERTFKVPGCYVFPGFIDLHVHLREPGFEYKETIATGAAAALSGGFTTICCMPNTEPAIDKVEIVSFIKQRAQMANAARILPIGAVTEERKGAKLTPIVELYEAGCVAFSDDGAPIFDSFLMRRALEWSKVCGVPVACHEEDLRLADGGVVNESPWSRKLGLRGLAAVAEEVMIARDIELARATGGSAHFCHVSTARGVVLIERAKNDGISVTAEVCPHHLLLTEERIHSRQSGCYDTNAKMNPPLRTASDVEALIAGLQSKVIDVVASDHAPHELDSKKCEFAKASFGIIGLQTTLPLLYRMVLDRKISLERMVECLSSGPAKCFRIDGGRIRRGDQADLIIFDPSLTWTLNQHSCVSISQNSPWWGQEFKGRVTNSFVGGELKFELGQNTSEGEGANGR